MGVPQKRHRIFFIATRLNVDLSKMNMSFLYKPILFSQIKTPQGAEKELSDNLLTLVNNAKYGDRNLERACQILRNKSSFFNYCFVYDDQVAPTITAHCNNIRWSDKRFLSKQDIISISTFPQDYNFLSTNLDNITYVCGMSVPPLMIKRVAERLIPYIKSEKNL